MSMALDVAIERLPHAIDLPLPARASASAAGMDLVAALSEPLELGAGERGLVPTGIVIALPEGYEGQIRPRSGLALKHGITVLNAPGTIDADYRGEVGVILVNLGHRTFVVRRGMRIAQLVVAMPREIAWREQAVSTPVDGRGTRGFGSTGLTDEPDEQSGQPTRKNGTHERC